MYAGYGCNDRISILNYIRVKPEIIDKIVNIINIKNINLKDYIGVHFRHTDRSNDINEYINKLNRYKDMDIYLSTDDSMAFDIICSRVKNNNIIQFTQPYNGQGKAIHIVSPDKYELMINILIDIYMLLKAKTFIQSSWSLVSKIIMYMRENNKSIFN